MNNENAASALAEMDSVFLEYAGINDCLISDRQFDTWLEIQGDDGQREVRYQDRESLLRKKLRGGRIDSNAKGGVWFLKGYMIESCPGNVVVWRLRSAPNALLIRVVACLRDRLASWQVSEWAKYRDLASEVNKVLDFPRTRLLEVVLGASGPGQLETELAELLASSQEEEGLEIDLLEEE
jgi:hypothetical protein